MIKRFFPRLNPLLRMTLLTGVAFLVMTALCAWTSSCGTATHKASVAADSIANSLKTAADLNHTLYTSGQISLEERQQVATLIDQATQANDVLVAQLSASVANGSSPNTQTILAAFQKLLTQIDALEANGVLHLKSTDAQTQFKQVTAAIRIQITVLQAVLAVTTSSNRSPAMPGGSGMIYGAAAITAEELESLIALALTAFGEGAALVQKLIAMKGKTDVELLADAATQNLAARTQAQADEKAE